MEKSSDGPRASQQDTIQRRLRSLTILEVMELLIHPRADVVAATHDELRRRRLTEAELKRARQYVQSPVYARVRLVNELLARSPEERRAWLRWLSKDPAPEVRIAVLRAMSATGDTTLTSRIREMAIHERDERVAKLAHRLLIETKER